ncbi:hypothetical protein JCM30760_05490 [Thiomicrorhabdus hydrogeniphila]
MRTTLFILALLSFLTGCASTYPLGMSEEQWKSITPEERQALLLKQQQYEEEQRTIRIKAAAEQRKLQQQQDMAERARLEKLYNQPQNGNVIMINLLGGNYLRGKTVKRVVEESYQIARGETKQIELVLEDPKKHYNTTERAYLQYSLNGNAIYLFLDNPSSSNYKRIALLRDGRWNCGTDYIKNLNTSYKSLHKMRFFVKEIGSSCNSQRRHH